jgi:hypothetical protein
MIPMIQQKIRRIVLNHIQKNKWYIEIDEIVDNIKFDKKVIYKAINLSIFPTILLDGYNLFLHNKGIHIVKIENKIIKKIKLSREETKKIEKTLCTNKDLRKISKKSYDHAIVSIYLSMNEECLTNLLKTIINTK